MNRLRRGYHPDSLHDAGLGKPSVIYSMGIPGSGKTFAIR